jgi:hypothetical protein
MVRELQFPDGVWHRASGNHLKGDKQEMDPHRPALSLETDQLDNEPVESPTYSPSKPAAMDGWVRYLSPEEGLDFRGQLEQLLKTFDVSDARQDVAMAEFLKWRMRCLWFLYRYLGNGHPYYAEFLLTVDREPDPQVNARFVIAGEAILDALLSDLDAGLLFSR